ncbi:MAG TPA: ATP-binding protein [Candidatus Tumulicola sp.]|nr:ATP-binding protein [Candidatus Tumulicola sp.]
MTIRGRLTATTVACIAITVVLFATLSIAAIDRALRSSFSARLQTTARAIATSVDVHHGRLSVDSGDLRALDEVRSATPFAIVDAGGNRIAGEAPPASTVPVGRTSVPIERDGHVAGTVLVWQSNLWIADFDREAAIISAGIGLLLVLFGVALSRRAVRSALLPVERIAGLAEGMDGRDLSRRLNADAPDELGRLCASFDRMLDRLQEAFDRERRFLADASHELRTPLAVLRAEAEIALRRERTGGEYRSALHSVERETMRLEELVDELLQAARTEVEARARQTLDAAELARRVGARVHPAAAVRDISIEVDGQAGALAHANSATVERALLAIVHNAIAHAPERGHVRLRVGKAGESVRIEIDDDGPGFTPAGLAHATERFWRGDAARPRGGTGLGLAIARTMVEANGGTLDLANGPAGGARVTVTLAG